MRNLAKETQTEPESLHGRAMDNLEFIRDAMNRSATFTAVPGYGGALMGVTAIGAGVISQMNSSGIDLRVWGVEVVLAVLIGLLAMWQKSNGSEDTLVSGPARKFVTAFLPPLIVGSILSAMLVFHGEFRFLPAVWLGLYGTAVVSGGAYSVKAVPVMGWCFIALSPLAAYFTSFGNYFMILGFGGLHIVFGLVIARKYGG